MCCSVTSRGAVFLYLACYQFVTFSCLKTMRLFMSCGTCQDKNMESAITDLIHISGLCCRDCRRRGIWDQEMTLEEEDDIDDSMDRCGASSVECWKCCVPSSLGLIKVVISHGTLIDYGDPSLCLILIILISLKAYN